MTKDPKRSNLPPISHKTAPLSDLKAKKHPSTLFDKKLALCSFVLDSTYGVSTDEWLEQNGFPILNDLTEFELDMLLTEFKAHATRT